MIDITTSLLQSSNRLANSLDSTPKTQPVGNVDTLSLTDGARSVSTVSTLARQLNEAATRAETRVGQVSTSLIGSITGDGYLAKKAQHDAEVPSTDDAPLLARSRQATAFLNGSDSNPFKGLTRDQLNLIAHDEGGTFTINERRAAWVEVEATVVPVPAQPISSSSYGRDLMVSRLFFGLEPGVSDGAQGMSVANMGRFPYEFLTRDDRNLLSQMYAYTQEQGADLAFVDRLANELGEYRKHDNGRLLGNFNSGHNYDAQGYQLTVSFNDKDAATVARILNGTSINSTLIDRGFLSFILDPGFGAIGNNSSYEFLEQMVTKFSDEGAMQAALGSQFDTYVPVINLSDNIVMTRSQDVKILRADPLVINDKGVWSVTEQGRAAGYSLDPQTGRARWTDPTAIVQQPSGSIADTPAGQRPNSFILEALSGNRNQPDARPIWLSSLFRLIQNYRP